MPNDPTSPNAEQIALWNDVLVANFTRHRAAFVACAGAHSDIAFRRHPVAAGARVLDVGCGFGETTIALGRVVGPKGAVVGVDACEPFLAVAREDARAIGHVSFRHADAQIECFEATFDLCFSRFGTTFFQDPIPAHANLRRALRPGGQLLALVWRRPDENEWVMLPRKVALSHLPAAPSPPGRPSIAPEPGPFSMSKAHVARAILEGAGWSQIVLEPIDTQVTFGATVEDAVSFLLSMGPAGEILREAKEEGVAKRPAIERDLARALKARLTPKGVVLGSGSWCVTARR